MIHEINTNQITEKDLYLTMLEKKVEYLIAENKLLRFYLDNYSDYTDKTNGEPYDKR